MSNIYQDVNGVLDVMDAEYFMYEICGGDPRPLIKLVGGSIYELDGAIYCIKYEDFRFDDEATTWINK